MKNGAKFFLILLLILALAAAAFFFLTRDRIPETPADSPAPDVSQAPTSAPLPDSGPTPLPPAVSPEAPPSESPSAQPEENISGRPDSTELLFEIDGKAQRAEAQIACGDFGTGVRGYGYSLYCLRDEFAFSAEENAEYFRSVSSDNCGLKLCFVPGTDVDRALPAFLDSYLRYTEIEYTGSHSLANSLMTEGMIATDGTQTYEAYLANADGGILAFIAFYPNEEASEQAPRLHAMLNSFAFHF